MFLTRVTLPFACFLLVFAWAGPAPAAHYLLGASSGGELQIGGGLPLPIQLTDVAPADAIADWGAIPTTGITPAPLQAPPATIGVGAGVFPPLLIGPRPGATVMDTAPGGALTIPFGALSRPAVQKTLGVNLQNPALYAVATNLGFKWPSATAMLGPRLTTMKAGGGTTALPLNAVTVYKATTGGGGKIKYRNPGKTATGFFGGPANFVITPMLGPPPGPALSVPCPGAAVCGPLKTTVAVTVFAIGANSAPPCAGAGCNALLLKAAPTGPQAPGGAPFFPVATLGGGVAGKNVYNIVAGTTPLGTISHVVAPVATAALPGNTALSAGFPWTTGRITVSHPAAAGSPERFVLSGADARTAGGLGAIQLVSGSVSIRPPPVAGGSGPNANRGYVRLELVRNDTAVPSISNWGLVALSVSLFTMALFTMARRSRGIEAGA